MYKGKEKCAGCGRSGEEVWRFSKDSLCHDCQDTLNIGRALVREKNLDRKNYNMDGLMTAFMTWYAVPVPEIDKALRELLRTFSQFDTRYSGCVSALQTKFLAGQAGCGTSHDNFCLPICTFEAARNLCKIIEKTSWDLKRDREHYKEELQEELAKQKDEIFNEGVKHGRNLLMQLNNNEITPNQFIEPVKKYSK
jgi:hypothetical protein